MIDMNQMQDSVLKVIEKRISVRSYSDKLISNEVFQKLNIFLSDQIGPFQSELRYQFVDPKVFSKDSGVKLGTYGIIKGAKYYVGVITQKENNLNNIDIGYVFEKFILYATSLGLGTVWLGGTFNKEDELI